MYHLNGGIFVTEEEKKTLLRLSNEESNRFTCSCLKTALLHLIAQKSFENITVSELVREAGVSRNSFYRNYGTMNELLSALREDLMTRVSDIMKSRETFENRDEWYVNLFSTVKEMQAEFRILLGIKVPLTFFSEGIDFGKLLPVSLTEPTYEELAAAGSFLVILFHWFTTGMKESPEEMAQICKRISAEKITRD